WCGRRIRVYHARSRKEGRNPSYAIQASLSAKTSDQTVQAARIAADDLGTAVREHRFADNNCPYCGQRAIIPRLTICGWSSTDSFPPRVRAIHLQAPRHSDMERTVSERGKASAVPGPE